MSKITLNHLTHASHAGGSRALASRTQLVPVAGQQALISPAKYAASNGGATYVFENRYVDDKPVKTVLIDSRTSIANRLEDALLDAIADEHPILSLLPHLHISYPTAKPAIDFTEISAPHRAFDAHFRLGTQNGIPVTEVDKYVQARNATPANAAALLSLSPVTILFGGWDSTRKTHQSRFPANVVGEIIGVLADQTQRPDALITRRSGARIDPVAPSFNISATDVKSFNELLAKDPQGQPKAGKKTSDFLIGAIPPGTSSLDGIATQQIIRSHVVSFASLRRLRFGTGKDGDAAIRSLLAAVAINLITRSDAELDLRANTHLREAEAPVLTLDHRHGNVEELEPLTVNEADQLLLQAYDQATSVAGLNWAGQAFEVEGNPAIPGAADATKENA